MLLIQLIDTPWGFAPLFIANRGFFHETAHGKRRTRGRIAE
jgi:hypothetical protein